MPQMDGIETLHKLQENGTLRTPVVMVTANALIGVDQMYLKEGFADYLSKPVKRDQLEEMLKQYLLLKKLDN